MRRAVKQRALHVLTRLGSPELAPAPVSFVGPGHVVEIGGSVVIERTVLACGILICVVVTENSILHVPSGSVTVMAFNGITLVGQDP